jgi:transposase-like protein
LSLLILMALVRALLRTGAGVAVEIITGVERRRHWRVDEKLRIVAEVEQPGACFAEVARRHDVSRGLLWNWRQQVRRGTLAAPELQFLPVRVMPEQPAAETPPARLSPSRKPSAAADAVIEIAFADGTTVRVGRDVGAAALRRVLGVLRG